MPEAALSPERSLQAPAASRGTRIAGSLLWLAGLVMALRLLTMALLPMSDTTEPRYAETARLMAESGDWITPWFEPGVPFWGKPPLSFWAQAGAIDLFGLHDFTVRLPSWLAMLGILWLSWQLARRQGGERLGQLTVLILASMALPFVSAGAVLTDPFLTLGTTLSLVALALSMEPGAPAGWRWAFFAGLAIGLLAKGPLAVVLVGLPVLAWGLWQGHWRDLWRALPWWRGSLLTAFIAVPWYVAAELKTPGFLDYFLVGEHLRRFIDPGWAGDLYGSAHDEPRGTIWLFLLWASLPWGPVGAVLLGRSLLTPSRRAALRRSLGDSALRLLIPAAFAPALFFSLSGNILWTYVLPGLPFLAILVARGLLPALAHPPKPWTLPGAAMAVPLTVTLIGLHFVAHPEQLRSAAPLVDALEALPDGDAASLYWLGDLPFSARYYSRGGARSIASDELAALTDGDHAIFLALRERDLEGLQTRYGPRLEQHYRDARHVLIRLAPTANN